MVTLIRPDEARFGTRLRRGSQVFLTTRLHIARLGFCLVQEFMRVMGYGVAGRSWVGVCLVLLMSFAAPAVPAMAASPGAGVQIGKSGLPLPRFVSLKSSRVNV